MIPFVSSDKIEGVNVGEYGYTTEMFVVSNEPATLENLPKESTRHYAETVLANHMSLLEFSSNPNGSGSYMAMEMHQEDAEKIPTGSSVIFHFKKDKEIGFGNLVAISYTPNPISHLKF